MDKLYTIPVVTIEKETIDMLRFPPEEVLFSKEDIVQRYIQMVRAMKLGNQFKDKVKILFEDSVGMKMVETTVWGLTDKLILLKRGMTIPFHRIHNIII